MKRMQFITKLAAAIALLASTAVVDAQPFLYAATQGDGSKLVRIDVGAGTVANIGDFGVEAAAAIAISPQGKLYTVTLGWPTTNVVKPQLASVNLATGLATPFGVNLYPETFMGIGFSTGGTLYGVNADSGTTNQNSLYRFDLTTGEATKAGVTGGCGEIMDLAWHPDGTMYGVDPTSLYRINRQTGQAELVTKLQGLTKVMGLAIDGDGNFYVAEIVPNAPLWRVNPVTGAATAVAGVSLSYPHGLEFIPPPPFLYATTGAGSTLVRIDVGAGTVTTIGGFAVPAADAIAISPQGKLYTVTQGWPTNGVNPQLASVDLATGLATPFGVNLNPEIFMGIGFSTEGTLYGVNAASGTTNQNSLYRFDLTTGEATKVGVTGGCGVIMDIAFAPDGTMYGVDPTSLYRINRQTGQAELVTKLQELTKVMGLAIDRGGNFYVSEIVTNAPLWRVDPVTGAKTAVAGVSLNKPHGLEFIPVATSNPFVLLLDGYWEPVVAVPGNLGLALPHLSNGVYKKVTIYNLASGFPGPTNEVVGTAYGLGGEGVIAYDLLKGALTAKFVGQNLVNTTNADGSTTMTGTWELNILEATEIYQSFVGGHIHMVDVLKYNSDGTILEHCFCHISPPLLVTIRTSQVEVCWNSEANTTYQVQYRSDLTTNLWTSLVGCVRSTGSKSCISDPVVLGQPQRFYRVVQTNCVPAL
jgi:hypothetical protein